MRQQVIVYECDNCHKKEQQPLASSIRIGRNVLPKDWLHVEGYTDKRSVFKLDLCTDCKSMITEITE